MRGRKFARGRVPLDSKVRAELDDYREIRDRNNGARGSAVRWNTSDNEGHPVPAEVYLARLTEGQRVTTARLVVRR